MEGVCAEGVYTLEPADANQCPIECEPGEYTIEGGGGAERTADVSCGWDRTDEVPGWQDFSGESVKSTGMGKYIS